MMRSLALCLCISIAYVGCGDIFGMCRNDPIILVPSPDATKTAVVFERDCGATTGYTVQVSIVPRGADLQEGGGNAFRCDHCEAASDASGRYVSVEWSADDVVTVAYPAGALVFKQEATVNGVKLEYEPMS